MSRPLRIEYPGTWYHVMNRGKGIFNEPRGVASYLTRMIRSDGLMDICKDYNLAKYSSASCIVETVWKKLRKDSKFRNKVNGDNPILSCQVKNKNL